MKVGIFGSLSQANKHNLIRRLFEKLYELDIEIYVENDFYTFLTNELNYEPPISGLSTNDISDIDIALSVGGDGTFLKTAACISRKNIPILGINTGHLGFLADIGNNELEDTLEELFKNYYRIEERTLIQLNTSENIFGDHNCALNEIAISKRDTSSMISIHTSLNGEYLTSYKADGLLIATPTGSTAYSMSVNGPIIVPHSNNIVLSPVAPHSLNVRPLVIPDSYTITLGVESRSKYFLVALDGRSEIVPSGIRLSVCKADYTIKIIKRYSHTFYQTLRDKLMWGTDPRMK